MTNKPVPQMLAELGKLYEERNKLYGDNYKLYGNIMIALFPNGIRLETVEDHNRFGVFVQIIAKITRYAMQFQATHVDSLDDMTVYAQMLQELDNELRNSIKPVTQTYEQMAETNRSMPADSVKAQPKRTLFDKAIAQ